MSTGPSHIKIGNTIGVMAPSSYVEEKDIEASKEQLENLGYTVFIHEQSYARYGQFAGTDGEKLEALHELYRNPEITCIWAAGGGNGALRLIDHLDYDLIKANPKPFIGFSDTTTLLNSIYAHTGVQNFHGPVFKNLHEHDDLERLLNMLQDHRFGLAVDEADIIEEGEAKGHIIGGNLSLFQYLLYDAPDSFLNNAIVCLEDCHEELSHIDRIFMQFERMGVFDKIAALVLGEFTDMKDTGRPFGFEIDEIVKRFCSDKGYPVIINAPFGHGSINYPFIIGQPCHLIAKSDSLSCNAIE